MRAVNLGFDWFYRKGGRLFYNVMDWGLNGLNEVTERIFVKKLICALSGLIKDAPAIMMLTLLMPYWMLTGVDPAQIAERNKVVYQSCRASALPAGLIAISVLLYLGILFFL